MLFSEKVFPLPEAADRLPGKRSRTTLWRWCAKGVRGVFLEHRVIGREIWTSMEALERFTARLADVGLASSSSATPVPAGVPGGPQHRRTSGQPHDQAGPTAAPAASPKQQSRCATDSALREAQRYLEKAGLRQGAA